MIFVSLYLLIAVPTKLTTMSRFAIHGHDVLGAILQLFFTLGSQPHLIFPCTSMYFTGLLTRFGIMSTLTQMWVQVAVLVLSSSFSLLITINRALAVSVRIPDRTKELVLQLFFAQLIVQLVLLAVVAFTLEDHNEEGRKICMKKIKVYPKEMDTMNGVNLVIMADVAMITTVIYVAFVTVVYIIRDQAKSSQSAQFLANQRRLTVGVLSFMMAELIGLAIPLICLNTCAFFNIGDLVVYQFAMVSMCFYPAFGSYFVLMSNTDYRNRIHSIFRRARKLTSLTRDQTVSITI
ncbi:unnamed protein product [Auanema sp. JU1783]|nr:unnamed protein product [Auanema sp. JU1783]